MSKFQTPGAAEILMAARKDETYMKKLREYIGDLIESFGGGRALIKWTNETEIVSDLIYYTLTTLSSLQTIGEEYTNIIEVNRLQNAVPSLIKRLCWIVFSVLGPYAVDRLLIQTERYLSSSGCTLPERQREILARATRGFRIVAKYLRKIHLVLFYRDGVYYELAKAVFGVRYLITYRGAPDETSKPIYKMISYLSGFHLLASILSNCVQYHHEKEGDSTGGLVLSGGDMMTTDGDDSDGDSHDVKCPLCLEKCHFISTAPCGHMFCWLCIHEWCASNPVCPVCRDQCHSSRIVYLRHYLPSSI